MALPITIPNTFANATTSIPLSQLDNNFSTVVVAINGIGNGAEALANVNITGGTVANVNVTSGNVTVTTVDATNIEVTNIKAKDGTAAVVISDSSGNVNFDSNTLFVDATNNNVGIGTSSPAAKLQVNGQIYGSNGTAAAPGFTSAGQNNAGLFFTDDGVASIVGVSAGGDECMRVVGNGKYLRMASGTGGIQFNGDTAAANALDDYEEGTWTPTISGSTTGSSALGNGYYTKIGRTVTAAIAINNVTFPSFTGTLRCSLPFTAANIADDAYRSGDVYFYPSGSWDTLANFVGITAVAPVNAAHVIFNIYVVDGDRQTSISNSNSNLSGAAGTYLRFSIVYDAA